MGIENELMERSQNVCEICESSSDLGMFTVAPKSGDVAADNIWVCGTCRNQLLDPSTADPNHWRCLNASIWSEVAAVKVVSWRMLNHLIAESWAADLLDMMYLDEEELEWAKTGMADRTGTEGSHRDSNGNVLQNGDSVVLIKDLDVKGANFTAKRGTAVRNISLVADNPEHIEGKVNGQQIVILTKFVKK